MIVAQLPGDLLGRPARLEQALDEPPQRPVAGKLGRPRPTGVAVTPQLPAPGPIAGPTAAERPDLPHHGRGRPPEPPRDRPVRLAALEAATDLLALGDAEPERRAGARSRAKTASRSQR